LQIGVNQPMKKTMKKRIQEMTLTPFANNENTPRYREHYGWLHIAYSAEIASQIELPKISDATSDYFLGSN